MAQSHAIEDYNVGIICALPLERTAVEAMLDEEHPDAVDTPGDNNVYTYGSIGRHKVVIASLGRGTYGTVSAAGVATNIKRSFPHLKYGLMVGIAGGVPRPDSEDGDVRLGDVVVGCVNGVPSIVNYRLGKETADGFDIRSELAEPPEALSNAVAALETRHQRFGPTYLMHLSNMLKKNQRLNQPRIQRNYYNIPDVPDRLFNSEFVHPGGDRDCEKCAQDGSSQVPREPRVLDSPPDGLTSEKFIRIGEDDSVDYPKVFLGSIGSADTLMKVASRRDKVFNMVREQRKAKLLCFEMEAAGIVKGWPCLVIRGICDYCDSHKNDRWQNFAAATAAAYAKDLLLRIKPEEVARAKPLGEVVRTDGPRISHTGTGPINYNSGNGTQTNYNQSGSHNRQINSG